MSKLLKKSELLRMLTTKLDVMGKFILIAKLPVAYFYGISLLKVAVTFSR